MPDNRPSSRGVRWRIALVGAVVAAAALGAGLLVAVHLVQSSGSRPVVGPAAAPRRGLAGTLPAFAAPRGKASGVGGAAVGIASAPISLRYTFDGGVDQPVADVNGGFPLRALTQNGGALELAPRGDGLSVRYPPRCRAVEKQCPRAILEGARVDALNPGTRPLEYGASILMTADDLADGANVLQKGYSVGAVSEFKLQVDHEAGHPSCVIASQARIYREEPAVDVADGVWHNLACLRRDARLIMIIDGVVAGSVYVPPSVSIANAEPLRIGGKGANTGNDQFAGQIDNVFVTIS